MRYLVLILALVSLGILLYRFYLRQFEIETQRALNHLKNNKLMDLNDLMLIYLLFCVLVLFGVYKHETITHFKKSAQCITDNVDVEGISGDYGVCINSYGNLVFKEQALSLKKIKVDFKSEIDLIEMDDAISTDPLDNLYFKLYSMNRNTSQDELYLLLSIYRNYYEVQRVSTEVVEWSML